MFINAALLASEWFWFAWFGFSIQNHLACLGIPVSNLVNGKLQNGIVNLWFHFGKDSCRFLYEMSQSIQKLCREWFNHIGILAQEPNSGTSCLWMAMYQWLYVTIQITVAHVWDSYWCIIRNFRNIRTRLWALDSPRPSALQTGMLKLIAVHCQLLSKSTITYF